jgi:hypothetical protein
LTVATITGPFGLAGVLVVDGGVGFEADAVLAGILLWPNTLVSVNGNWVKPTAHIHTTHDCLAENFEF